MPYKIFLSLIKVFSLAVFFANVTIISFCNILDGMDLMCLEYFFVWHLQIINLGKVLVQTTISIYREIQIALLPTPEKSHYTYNMRDVSKVFQGMCMADTSALDKKVVIRLWCHECLRVFHDRLVDDEDRQWFLNYLQMRLEDEVNVKTDYIFGVTGIPEVSAALKKLAFGDILDSTAIPKK